MYVVLVHVKAKLCERMPVLGLWKLRVRSHFFGFQVRVANFSFDDIVCCVTKLFCQLLVCEPYPFALSFHAVTVLDGHIQLWFCPIACTFCPCLEQHAVEGVASVILFYVSQKLYRKLMVTYVQTSRYPWHGVPFFWFLPDSLGLGQKWIFILISY